MNLGKLLAAGKSIKSGREAAAYRANKQVYLPKFGSAKNPFKSDVEQPVVEAEGSASAQSSGGGDSRPMPKEGNTSATARADFGAAQESRAARSVNSAPASVKQKQPAAQVPHGKKTADWVCKFNPASLFRSAPSKEEGKSGTAAKVAKTVATQTELSLDSVKVVHNDLSDADVEVVPMKSRSSVPDVQPPKKSWEFLGERLFGVEAT